MPPAIRLLDSAHLLFGNLPTSDVRLFLQHMIDCAHVDDVDRRDLMLKLSLEPAYPNVNRLLKGELSNAHW
jgi:hypothetical protein